MKNVKLYIAITYGLVWAAGGALYFSKSLMAAYPGASTLCMSVCMFFPLIANTVAIDYSDTPLPLSRNPYESFYCGSHAA